MISFIDNLYEPIKPEIIDKQTGPDQIIETLELFNYNQSDLISRIENGRTEYIVILSY